METDERLVEGDCVLSLMRHTAVTMTHMRRTAT